MYITAILKNGGEYAEDRILLSIIYGPRPHRHTVYTAAQAEVETTCERGESKNKDVCLFLLERCLTDKCCKE